MKALLYISKSSVDFTPDELNLLSVSSGIKNERLGITGYLYYENGSFLQYIEGEEEPLMELFAAISNDNRHIVRDSVTEDIQNRRFPHWSMKNIGEYMGEKNTIEQTIIQTINLFEQNHISIPEGTKLGLFRFMDDLARAHNQLF